MSTRGSEAQIAPFAKSADPATWWTIHAAAAQGRADLRRRRSRRPASNGGNADFAVIQFLPFADAAYVRSCSNFVFAVQRKSPVRSFASVDLDRTDSVLSPQLDPTTQTRTLLPFARAVIADAAFARVYSTLSAAMKRKSPYRSFTNVDSHGTKTALSPQLSWIIETWN
ncbi:hypothetical protein FGE21_19305 [Phaeobacter sp. B1627]|nr:hypothetical protein FGE21_19305 [Phaeobacter sp. B1627]